MSFNRTTEFTGTEPCNPINTSKTLNCEMDKKLYLEIEPCKQQEIISNLKTQTGLSWTEISKKLSVGRSMVLHYNRGRHRISLENFTKLCDLANVSPSSFGDFALIKIDNKPKPSKTPSLNEDLAEFLGALSGDGCLTSNYSTVITCDANSDKYYIHKVVKAKFKKLFGVIAKTRLGSNNQICCRVYSKKVFNFLSQKIGYPIGVKGQRLRIPRFVMRNKRLSRAFLRGLFDTDGGFHRHNPYSAKVEITSFYPKFREDIVECLTNLGFRPVHYSVRVYIMSKTGIDKFFTEIKPHNFKHLYKYKKFKEIGQVPRHRDINYNSEEFKRFVEGVNML